MALTRATDKIIANSDGNLNLSGIVTASSFIGSGTGLTGVASTDHIKTSTTANFTDGIQVGGATTLTGALTGTTGTFTGNLGVGGVLTYEDVTNIDSVGVITARDGLRVTGISTFNGDVQFTNANPELEFNNGGPRFRVPAANTLAIHNGGTLGSTNNEALRITSTGSVLVGKIVTTMATTGTRIDPQSTLITASSTSTNLATANGANISLINNSATDNNFSNIGGYNSNSLVTSQINFVNTSHSSRTGDITFMTHNGSSMPERLRITSGGKMVSTLTSPDPFNTIQTNLELVNGAGNQGAGSKIDFYCGNGRAHIQSQVTGANSNSGLALVFATAPDGAGADERLRIETNGDVLPGANNAQDLGSSSKSWANIYTNDLNLSNKNGKNDVDGTWGSYTIQEGESDLFLINNRSGKKYMFMLKEVV